MSRSQGRNKPRGFPVANCGCKCSNINLVELCTPVSEQLRGTGEPAEQILRTFTAGRELHRDGIFLSCPWVSPMSPIKFCTLFVIHKVGGFVYLYISHFLILAHPFHPTFPIPSFCFRKGDLYFCKIKNLSTDEKCNWCLQQSYHEAFDLLPIITRI